MRASKLREVLSASIRPALWFCACNLLAAALSAQCTGTVTPVLTNQTVSSGTATYSDNNALSTNAVINGSASITLFAGHCIELQPGFHATAGTAATTFHAWVDVAPNGLSVSPSSGTGLTQQFTWTASSPSGSTYLTDVYALFAPSISGQNACYIRYNQPSNLLYLADNTGTVWQGGLVPQTAGTASNAQCSIDANNSSISGSGAQLTVKVSVTFQSSYAGTQNNYLIAYDQAGLNSAWQQVGTWTVGSALGAPSITSLTPSSAAVGTGVMISGSNFGAIQGSSTVKFNGVVAAISSWSNTGIMATVPTGATTGNVVVTVGGAQSNGFSFTVTSQETISQPSQPSGPSSGQVSTAYSYSTGGSVSSLGHSVQYQFVWGDGNTTDWLPVGTTTASHTWASAGTYNVAALARCSIDTGIVSQFSTSLVLSISAQTPSVTLLTPSNGATGQGLTPTLSWNAVSGATSYDVGLGTPTPAVITTVSSTSYTTATLSPNSTYSWYIVAKNGSTVLGTSATWSFTTISNAPGTVTLLSPANSATNQPLSPTLTWNTTVGATSYDVALGSPTPTVVATVTNTNYTPSSPLSGSTTYSWYVVAKNAGGSAPPSPTWSFTTIPGPPAQVTLSSPANGAGGQGLTPTLSWNASPGASSYDVALGSPTPVVVATVSTTSYTPSSGLTPKSTYSWYIVAKNAGGSAQPSDTWTFMTDPPSGYSGPPYPSREYIYLGSRVLAIDNSAAISGKVLQGSSGVSGVTMTLSGPVAGTATTAGDGSYSFVNLAPGNYIVSPARSRYTFTPSSSPVITVTNVNVTQGFNASPVSYLITGAVSGGASCTSGVLMTLTGGAQTSTDANGNYTFGAVPGTYTITPSKSGCGFSPTYTTVTVTSGNVTASTFTGYVATYGITGLVSGGSSCTNNVLMTLTGSAQGTTYTNSSGNYAFAGLPAGNYTITPSLANCSFSPTSTAVTITTSNVTAATFSGSPSGQPPYWSGWWSAGGNYGGTAVAKFTFPFHDSLGPSNIQWVGVQFGHSLGAQNSCMAFFFNYATWGGYSYLYNDTNTGVVSGYMGQNGILHNSQCDIDLSGARLYTDSNGDLDLDVPILLAPSYTGYQNIWLAVQNNQGLDQSPYWLQVASNYYMYNGYSYQTFWVNPTTSYSRQQGFTNASGDYMGWGAINTVQISVCPTSGCSLNSICTVSVAPFSSTNYFTLFSSINGQYSWASGYQGGGTLYTPKCSLDLNNTRLSLDSNYAFLQAMLISNSPMWSTNWYVYGAMAYNVNGGGYGTPLVWEGFWYIP